MRSLGKLFRSVLPADLWQLTLLAGLVCLTVCIRIPWVPGQEHRMTLLASPYSSAAPFFPGISIGALFLTAAALCGYYACFWPGPRALRRVVAALLLPASIGFALSVLVTAYQFSEGSRSVLEKRGSQLSNVFKNVEAILRYAHGPQVCLVGIVFVLAFVVRLAGRRSRLPLELGCATTDNDSWQGVLRVTFFAVGPAVFLINALSFAVALALSKMTKVGHLEAGVAAVAVGSVICWYLALVLAGQEGWKTVAKALRFDAPARLSAATAIGVLLLAAIPMIAYAYARADWAAHPFSRLNPPDPVVLHYLKTSPFLVAAAISAAILEEIIFRGYLQTKFIERYGMARGILLTGFVWAAAHFRSYVYNKESLSAVAMQVVYRIAVCTILSFLFGWLVLKFGYLYPAMFAHAEYNLWDTAAITNLLPAGINWPYLFLAFWCFLTILLYRFWPPDGWDWPQTELAEPDAAIPV